MVEYQILHLPRADPTPTQYEIKLSSPLPRTFNPELFSIISSDFFTSISKFAVGNQILFNLNSILLKGFQLLIACK
nr:MAG TPA: hypothetical protein [Caudoviricetes sp.]